MEPNGSLPSFNYHGYLPEGIHNTTLDEMRERFVINEQRKALWDHFQDFLSWPIATGLFSHAYIDGGFITNKAHPEDIDLILQTKAFVRPGSLQGHGAVLCRRH